MAKQRSATSLASILRIGFFSGVFVGVVMWGAVRDWNRVVIFASATVVIVTLGFVILNWLAKPDENVEPGKPRLK